MFFSIMIIILLILSIYIIQIENDSKHSSFSFYFHSSPDDDFKIVMIWFNVHFFISSFRFVYDSNSCFFSFFVVIIIIIIIIVVLVVVVVVDIGNMRIHFGFDVLIWLLCFLMQFCKSQDNQETTLNLLYYKRYIHTESFL